MSRSCVFSILILTLFGNPVLGQELPEILKTQNYKRGIYRDFAEFLKNSPSILNAFEMVQNSDFTGENYDLNLLDSSFGRKQLKQIWGACDGKTIYVNEIDYGQSLNFRELISVGRYSYHIGTVVRPGAGTGTTPVKAAATYIMNINNGNFYLLSRDMLRAILQKDNELRNAYENEKRKGKKEVMLKYLKEYNTKYINEATLERLDQIEIILYRRDNKQVEQSLKITINDSLVFEMGLNRFCRFQCLDKITKICLNGLCRDIFLDRKQINYIECSWDKDDRIAEARKVERKEGEFYIREIESIHYRKDN